MFHRGPKERATVVYMVTGVALVASVVTQARSVRAEDEPPTLAMAAAEPGLFRSTAAAQPRFDPTTLSPAEKSTFLNRAIAEQARQLGAMVKMRDEAREAKDIVRLNCVKDKVDTGAKVLERSRSASDQAFSALAAGANDLVDVHLLKVDEGASRMRELEAEAEACVGSEEESGTTVEVEDGSGEGAGGEGGFGDAGGGGAGAGGPAAGPTVPPVASDF